MSNCCFYPREAIALLKRGKSPSFFSLSVETGGRHSSADGRNMHADSLFSHHFFFNFVLGEFYYREQSRLWISFPTAKRYTFGRSCVVTWGKRSGGNDRTQNFFDFGRNEEGLSWRFDLFCFLFLTAHFQPFPTSFLSGRTTTYKCPLTGHVIIMVYVIKKKKTGWRPKRFWVYTLRCQSILFGCLIWSFVIVCGSLSVCSPIANIASRGFTSTGDLTQWDLRLWGGGRPTSFHRVRKLGQLGQLELKSNEWKERWEMTWVITDVSYSSMALYPA